MSAVDNLPADVRTSIEKQSPSLREDLLAIPAAEAAGWAVTFRNNHWHKPAQFVRGDVFVWRGSNWRRATASNDRLQRPVGFATLKEALSA